MPSSVYFFCESTGFLQLSLGLSVNLVFSSSCASVVVAFLANQKAWKFLASLAQMHICLKILSKKFKCFHLLVKTMTCNSLLLIRAFSKVH